MEEFKTINCDTSEESSVIGFWTNNFGWELVSTQAVDKVDVDFDNSTDTFYKTNYNYVKLTFKRDSNRPNYNELAQLEKKYFSVPKNYNPDPSKKGIVWCFILATFFALSGSVSIVGGFLEKEIGGIIACLIFLVLAALFIFLAIRKIKKNASYCDSVYAKNRENNERRKEILKEAFQICESSR